MNTLIPLVRSDRLREINTYKSKDYSFRKGENKYIYISKINIVMNKSEYFFQLRDNQSEQKFYISINDSCIYLTIENIYNLLKQVSDKVGIRRVRNILMGDRNKIVKITYTGLEFEAMFFSKTIPKGTILLPESNMEISYEYLFLLTALIQDKSNYLWMLSSKINNKYIDGILRLFSCLISTKNNMFLEKLGWEYDSTNNKYFLNDLKKTNKSITTKDIKGNKIKIKYYLTEKQYNDIMKVRNPSNFVNDGGLLR